MSQAWSFSNEGKLAPYTYWYDHAPLGWILISLWTTLTGGFYTFGFSLNSGRVFMLVLHLISSVYLYLITKKLTGSKLSGLAAILFFSLTPLGIYFQRRVLLDNIMIMWVLISLYYLLEYKNRLLYILFSAVALAFAILSKENAIFFIPLFFYIVYSQAHKRHRLFAVTQWLLIIGSIVSLYFVYALVKGEFFPAYSTLGGNTEHVSLLETLKYQSSRTGGSILDTENSLFWQYMRQWSAEDWVIIYGGVAAMLFNFLLAIRNFNARVVALFAASMFFFLMRGGIVIEFYVIPLIPLLAVNLAYALTAVANVFANIAQREHLHNSLLGAATLVFSVVMLSQAGTVRDNRNLYTSNQAQPQRDAVEWIKANRSPDEFIVIDNYGYLDLRKDPNKQFNNADWYWKIDTDKDILQKKLGNDPNNIDYLAVTPQMEFDIKQSGLSIVGKALGDSRPVTQFYRDGWGVTIWGVHTPQRNLMAAWESYKRDFIKDGQVIDPSGKITTSEGQAYALLRAVWMKDQPAFFQIHKWTKDHLYRDNNLLQWRYSKENPAANDPGSATDADQDYALALLFGSRVWNDSGFQKEAVSMIRAIWQYETAALGSKVYSLAGEWGDKPDELVVNPSYLSPSHYRIFAQVDPSNDWKKVVDSSYEVLDGCTHSPLDAGRGVLPAEWCAINKASGVYSKPSQSDFSTEYGYNAFRVPWRVMLDYQWNRDPRARDYLRSLVFLSDQWNTHKKLSAVYTHDGQVQEEYESAAAYAGNLGYFMLTSPTTAKTIYTTKIAAKFYENEKESYWEDPDNYYTQNITWFGTALYSNQLPNLWTK